MHRHPIGDLPRFLNGLNRGRLDRRAVADLYGFSLNEIKKAYVNWIMIFPRKKESTLSFKEYLDMLVETGITPSNVGNSVGQYNLSRYNDEGHYHKESCRFIQASENLAERKLPPPSKELIKRMIENNPMKKEEIRMRVSNSLKGKKKTEEHKRKISETIRRKNNSPVV